MSKRIILVNPEKIYLGRRHTDKKDGYVDRLDLPFNLKKQRNAFIGCFEDPVEKYIEGDEPENSMGADITDAYEFSCSGFDNKEVRRSLENIFCQAGEDENNIFVSYYEYY